MDIDNIVKLAKQLSEWSEQGFLHRIYVLRWPDGKVVVKDGLDNMDSNDIIGAKIDIGYLLGNQGEVDN